MHLQPHHPPHPPPNFCCQLVPRQTPGVITIFPVKPLSHPKVDRFWDPVRQDAATRPPTPPMVKPICDPIVTEPPVAHLSDSDLDSPTSVMSMDESVNSDTGTGEQDRAQETPRRPKRIRRRRSKNYPCTFCPSAFERPSSLAQHLRRHTGEKPFKCPSCTKMFSIASNARRHTKGCKGSSPHFEFTSMPSPPSTPPYRSLKLEINNDVHGKGRPWEVCADEPSHRLCSLEVEELDDLNELPPPGAKDRHSVWPKLAGAVTQQSNNLRHITSSASSSPSPVDYSRAGARQSSSSDYHFDHAPPSILPRSSSSAPFDWRVGRVCRGATGTRYRVHQRVEPPIPVPASGPINAGVRAKSESEDEDDSILFSPEPEQRRPLFSKPTQRGPVHAPPPLLRARPSARKPSEASDKVADRRLPTPSGISFKASPYAPLSLSSPFYPSSRRWSTDSGASTISTTSTVVSSDARRTESLPTSPLVSHVESTTSTITSHSRSRYS